MGNLTNMGNDKTFNQFAVIGAPIEHSLSPILHNAVFKQLKLNAQYEKIQLPTNDLTDFIKAISQKKITGFNITIPHKTDILSYLDHINPRAKEIGAVNCVLNRNDKLWGFNTDWYGFSMLLKNNRVDISGKSILIFGAGGVAYSVLYSLISANAGKIFINNRTHKNTIKLIDNFKSNSENMEISGLKCMDIISNQIDLIINCTSLGMSPLQEKTPISKALILPQHIIIDTIYTPLKPRLLQEAESIGAKIINGLDMFIFQGLASIDIWYGENVSEKVNHNLIKEKIIRKLC